MIDIHCHILPDVDDGAVNLAESIKMAKIAHADGIAKIVATPHISGLSINRQFLVIFHALLSRFLKEQFIPVDIVLGGEVSVYLDSSEFNLHTINGTQYILIELPASHLPKNTAEILFNLIVNGHYPIIAHPERNRSILEEPDKLFNLLTQQVLIQITAGSITGMFGPDSRACARFLLRKGLVSFIASDAHDAANRRPVLSEGLEAAGKIIGKDNALKLVTENPEAMLAGKPITRDRQSNSPDQTTTNSMFSVSRLLSI
jgi:protein-tyrosine phosphatase